MELYYPWISGPLRFPDLGEKLHRNSGECEGGSCEYGVVGLPKFQKRPDVHKIVLSIKLRSPPPGKTVNFEDFLLICTVFTHFGPFSGGGGGG